MHTNDLKDTFVLIDTKDPTDKNDPRGTNDPKENDPIDIK